MGHRRARGFRRQASGAESIRDGKRERHGQGKDKVKARLLNAMYYNVPQSRQRMIFVGVRDNLGIEPGHPKAQGQPMTVREAFDGLKEIASMHRAGSKLARCCRVLRQGQSADELYPNWGFQLNRLHWKHPAPTIGKSGGASGLIHPILERKLTGREYARLSSYPDRFQFIGSTATQQDRIGNSVPPNFMRAIAEHIRDNILGLIPRLSIQ